MKDVLRRDHFAVGEDDAKPQWRPLYEPTSQWQKKIRSLVRFAFKTDSSSSDNRQRRATLITSEVVECVKRKHRKLPQLRK